MCQEELVRAAEILASAEALVLGAGAGLSVDAGIPAYRRNPRPQPGGSVAPLGSLSPVLFRDDPALAWGRAGRQLVLFRQSVPHAGYAILRAWAQRTVLGAFVLTSNVDGLFLAAGFSEEQLLEGHGSLHYLQCTTPCNTRVWSAATYHPVFAATDEFAAPPLPLCPECHTVARPNVFMFGDSRFVTSRADVQNARFSAWLKQVRGRRVAVLECGAGTAVPTIRLRCEALANDFQTALIRINLAESSGCAQTLRIPLPALSALQRLEAILAEARGFPSDQP